MLSDNGSTSDSSSDDDAGANSSGYTRRKTRNTRCTFRDQYTDRIGPTGDNTSLTFARVGQPDGVNVIDVSSQDCDGLDDDEKVIPGEAVTKY